MKRERNKSEKDKYSIIPVIDKYLKDKIKRRIPEHWGGSSMGACYRQRFWSRQGKEQTQPMTIEDMDTLDYGSVIHKIIDERIQSVILKLEYKVECKEYDYEGYLDALVKIKDKKIVYDFKSINDRGFQYLGNEGKFHHLLQLASYILFLQKQTKDPKIKYGRLLYIGKGDKWKYAEKPKNSLFILTEEWKNLVIDDLKNINHYWKKKELPPKIKSDIVDGVKVMPWECRYCSFKGHCWKPKKEEKKGLDIPTRYSGYNL